MQKSLLGLGITWSLLPWKTWTQTEADQPLKSASNGHSSTRALDCGVAQTPGAAHATTRAPAVSDGPRPSGAGTRLPARLAKGRPRGGAPRSLSYWRAPGSGIRGTPGHLSAPSRVKPLAHTPTQGPKPLRPGARASAAYAVPPLAPRNLRYSETIPPGCPAGLQNTACNIPAPTQTSPSPDSVDLQMTTRLSGGSRETACHQDLTRNPAPSASFSLFQAERPPIYHRRPPSRCWANTEVINGHPRPGSGSPF